MIKSKVFFESLKTFFSSITLNQIFNYLSGLEVIPKSLDYHPQQERIVIMFDGQLMKSDGKLTLKYKGHLRDDLKGFYRSLQSTGGDEKTYAAVTHFEVWVDQGRI